MKNIFIIIGMTVILGFSTMWVTGEVSVQIDKNKSEAAEAAKSTDPSLSPTQQLAQTERSIGEAMGSMRKRQTRAITAGIIGASVGFIGGILIVLRRDRKAKLNQSGGANSD